MTTKTVEPCKKCGGTEFKKFGGGGMSTENGPIASFKELTVCANCGTEVKPPRGKRHSP